MQVHMRLYLDGDLFETLVVNASERETCAETEKLTVHHKLVEDESDVSDKIFQVWLKVPTTGMEFLLHMPIGQSEDWEVLSLDDSHTLGFYRLAATSS